jgi:hypothetical protein
MFFHVKGIPEASWVNSWFAFLQIDAVRKTSKFADEIREEQEERKRQEEDKKRRQQAFKERAAFFTSQN